MKIKLYFIAVLIMLAACSNKKDTRPVTAMDTGRDFIRATLDGDFKTAESLLLNEPENNQLFDSYKELYSRLRPDQKDAYHKASYNINTFKDLNDSVSVINYSNSYMQKPMNIKLVRKDNLWRVDFKYTSQDSTATP